MTNITFFENIFGKNDYVIAIGKRLIAILRCILNSTMTFPDYGDTITKESLKNYGINYETSEQARVRQDQLKMFSIVNCSE